MPKTTSLLDCRRLADAVTSVGGTVPDKLQHLLSAHALLSSPGATEAPETAILDHALNGTLDQRTLDKLLTAAATAQMVSSYRGDLARRSEHVLVGEFHRQREAGAADEILASVRPRFDKAAAAIMHARTVIPMESSAEHVLATAGDGALEAWRSLDSHVRVVDKIGAIASQFGPRLGPFAQITEYNPGQGHLLEDRAVMATDGPLVADSALFRTPGAHRASPWCRTTPRLHTVESAQAHYSAWAADEFDHIHSGPQQSWIDEQGHMHEIPRPENPFKTMAKASAT